MSTAHITAAQIAGFAAALGYAADDLVTAVRFREDGDLDITSRRAVAQGQQLQALAELDINPYCIIRGTLHVGADQVTWTEVVLDKTDRPALRNGRYVTVVRKIAVDYTAEGPRQPSDPAG